jgi:hypothetical protein
MCRAVRLHKASNSPGHLDTASRVMPPFLRVSITPPLHPENVEGRDAALIIKVQL